MKRGLLIVLILTTAVAGAAAAAYRFRSSLSGGIDALIPWVVCAQERDRDRAIAACTIVIDRGAREALVDRVSAYGNRGIAYENKGEMDRALADYDSAIALDPAYESAYFNRGTMYGQKGDFQRAIADFDQSIRIAPNDAFAYYDRGLMYEARGDLDHALADFTRFREMRPNDPAAKAAEQGVKAKLRPPRT